MLILRSKDPTSMLDTIPPFPPPPLFFGGLGGFCCLFLLSGFFFFSFFSFCMVNMSEYTVFYSSFCLPDSCLTSFVCYVLCMCLCT